MDGDRELGQWLRRRREELGYSSRQQLVTKLRNAISYSHLTKLETGERPLTAQVAQVLAPVLKLDPVYLLKRIGLVPEGTPAANPEPPVPQLDTWAAVQAAIEASDELTKEEKRGLILALRPIVTALLDQAKRRRPPAERRHAS